MPTQFVQPLHRLNERWVFYGKNVLGEDHRKLERHRQPLMNVPACGGHEFAASQSRVAWERSRMLAGRVLKSSDETHAMLFSGSGPLRPCAPWIRVTSILTLNGGQPKKSSHGS